jgi:hypothetical protein
MQKNSARFISAYTANTAGYMQKMKNTIQNMQNNIQQYEIKIYWINAENEEHYTEYVK